MTTRRNKRKRQPSSCPHGWHPAGHVVTFTPTIKQELYCHRAIGISRFVFNLCVATHRFCRTNRLPWPSWQDLNKEINASKLGFTQFKRRRQGNLQVGGTERTGSS